MLFFYECHCGVENIPKVIVEKFTSYDLMTKFLHHQTQYDFINVWLMSRSADTEDYNPSFLFSLHYRKYFDFNTLDYQLPSLNTFSNETQ